MRRKFPEELQDLLAAELRLIEANVLAQRWDACHRAIDRLKAEALIARPWKLPLADRMELTPHQIGITIRVANAIEAAGLETVAHLLDATEQQILAIPNFGQLSIVEVRDQLKKLFRNEARAGDKHGIFERLSGWPRRELEVEL